MAITSSAATGPKYLDSGNPPYSVAFDVTGVATESGDIDLVHNAGRTADEFSVYQVTGTAQLVLRKSDTANKTTITLGTVPSGGTTFRVSLRFNANDAPDVS